jgi:hypothetical protein
MDKGHCEIDNWQLVHRQWRNRQSIDNCRLHRSIDYPIADCRSNRWPHCQLPIKAITQLSIAHRDCQIADVFAFADSLIADCRCKR